MVDKKHARRAFSAASLAALLAAAPALSAAGALDILALNAPLPAPPPQAPAAETTMPAGVFDVPPEKIYYLLPTQVDMSQVPPAPAEGSEREPDQGGKEVAEHAVRYGDRACYAVAAFLAFFRASRSATSPATPSSTRGCSSRRISSCNGPCPP